MKNRAFTLIELLVVVLIIGTLAAIALPQYQKTVDKAHMAQLVILANAANVAEEEYYLANGSYTNQWGDLSIDIPATTVSGNSLSSSAAFIAFSHNRRKSRGGASLRSPLPLRKAAADFLPERSAG